MTSLFSRFAFFVALFYSLTVSAQKQIIDKVICEVGNEVILLSELAEQIKLAESRQGPMRPEDKCFMLENMMVSKLLVHQAFVDSIIVSEEEVEAQLNARIERILESMGNDVTQFEAYYGKSINDVRTEFREDLKNQLI